MRKGNGGKGRGPGDDYEDDEDEGPWEDPSDVWRSFLEPVNRMSRDMRAAAATLGDDEVRHLVDSYYAMQEDRKRAAGQQRALDKSGEPHSVLNWLFAQSSTLEQQIKGALDVYTEHHVMGSWLRQIYGIGPVISAGLLAHIYMGRWCAVCRGRSAEDCERRQKDKKLKLERHKFQSIVSCPTVGHIWAFAGWAADGQKPWERGTKRPFNAKFKVLCWKAGQSFMKFGNAPECYYGRVYQEQKAKYIAKNDAGGFVARAAEKADAVRKTTDAWAWYNGCFPAGSSLKYEKTGAGLPLKAKQEAKTAFLRREKLEPGKGQPMLPPGHYDAMARRYAVKLFLAHLHGEWYERHFGKPPPLPYPIAILGHAHIAPLPVPPAPEARARTKTSQSAGENPMRRAKGRRQTAGERPNPRATRATSSERTNRPVRVPRGV